MAAAFRLADAFFPFAGGRWSGGGMIVRFVAVQGGVGVDVRRDGGRRLGGWRIRSVEATVRTVPEA